MCGLLKSTATLMRKRAGSFLAVAQTQLRATVKHCWLNLTPESMVGKTCLEGVAGFRPFPLCRRPAHPSGSCLERSICHGVPLSLPITGCSLLESRVQRPRRSLLTWPRGPGRAPGWAEPPASPEPETNPKRPNPLPRSGTGKTPSPAGRTCPLTKWCLSLSLAAALCRQTPPPAEGPAGVHDISPVEALGGRDRREFWYVKSTATSAAPEAP